MSGNGSMQTGIIGKISYLPLDQIIRPIPPVLDYDKIDAMVSTLNGVPMASKTCAIGDITSGELPPVDVLVVRDNGITKYFAFGGCHRFQAYDRVNKKGDGLKEDGEKTLVKCKILPATKNQLKLYLGASVDKFFE